MSEPVLLYEVKNHIAHVRMNRPAKLNALDTELSLELRDAWRRFEADDNARVAILSGAGSSFCAGMDISPGAVDRDIPYLVHQSFPENGFKVFKPIVGAVQGNAAGAGFVLGVWSSDITVCGESAKLSFPEPRVGVAISAQRYLPYVPFKVSLQFLMLAWRGGAPLSAKRSLELGLVNKVVPDADMYDAAMEYAELLKGVPPLYIKSIKHGHYQSATPDFLLREWEYLDFTWPQIVASRENSNEAGYAGSENMRKERQS